MAKKAAAKRPAKKSARGARRRIAGKVGVDFKPLHDAMDAAIAALKTHQPSLKREQLLFKLSLMRGIKMCGHHGMFAELK